MNGYFKKQIEALRQRHEALLQRPNEMQEETNGIIRRYGLNLTFKILFFLFVSKVLDEEVTVSPILFYLDP